MKILIFAGYYLPHVGGYTKNVHELAKRLVENGHNVTVVTTNTENAKTVERKDKVVVVRFPVWDNGTSPILKFDSLFTLYEDSRFGYDADLIITQTRFYSTSLIGTLIAKRYRKPLIHVERGSCHSVVKSLLVSLIIRLYDHTIGSMIVKLAKINIGVSKSACDFIEHIGGKNTQVIYNGMNLELNKGEDRFDICYVGRLIYAKGIQDLISAFEICCQKLNSLRLIIVGDGDYKKQLEQQADKTKYGKRILFVGTKEHCDLIEVLSNAYMFVNPSYSEGLPTSVMEAGRIGLPIIATDVGGTNEIIEHGKSGLLFKPHDINQLANYIMQLVNDKVFARQLGYNALIRIRQKFNWDNIVKQYENLIEGAIKVG